ncbi:succinate semialdehyde dehydrogenase NADP+ linked [Exophiala xenobiotica]|nr:succinate semialdehyde dehydrogenase NADP+ linked [Exophiala xenobiotica]KAK5373654.1 succinate semialdehyde dehydrogenase NADP+ linked [Exophiala xenobiotica]KAK5402334.1 succinate semialdehyde dehydrogenase NADP+ linked [Exophiala xenobiotica]KAK5419244.1 succinate semialdehyde dehydrogenase NADP+ linked [Exophiala xenobiotica]KAK5466732.1 succinate semialdehyde dehydrogenase NADP+ linked [Exophiala xenobiotica]
MVRREIEGFIRYHWNEDDTLVAIDAAKQAFSTFQHTHPKARARILRKWYDLMVTNRRELATILMYENGRPITGALQEIDYAASFLDWFAGEAERSYGYSAQGSIPGNRFVTIQQPVGVVGILTPWNFPSAMITRKIGGAIAAGCSVVIKPAAETPYSALALAKLGEEAGLPAGVMNVITTDRNVAEVGKVITTHEEVKKVSFTGSTGVGKLLMQQASSTMKKCSFELGGNAPYIVFDDADLDLVMQGLLAGKFRGSGQTCVSPNRIFVQAGIYESFLERFKQETIQNIRPGPLDDERTTLGCLIASKAVKKIAELVSDAEFKGAKAVLGGKRDDSAPETFYPATILKDMTSDMQASQTELFGPVATVYKFDSEQEAIKAANKASVGLAGYVYTSDIGRAWRTAEALQVGMTGVNTGIVSDPYAPFGGVKESGFGREGGRHGIEEFQTSKTITLGGLGLPSSQL